MNYLIDTNVISELRKPVTRRNAGVKRWFQDVESEALYLSVLVLGEIRKGIEFKRVSDPAQAVAIESWLDQLVGSYADRILPVNYEVAQLWGRAQCVRSFPVIDGLLAATAQANGLQLVTRNVVDLEGWPASDLLVNPFD